MTLYNSNGTEKPDEKRLRRNKPTYDKVNVEWDGVVRGFDLPKGFKWHELTLIWWDMWRRCPQSMIMIDSDWEVHLVTASMHSAYWSGLESGKLSPNAMGLIASEIRRREDLFGGSYESRRQMKMEINSPKDDPAAKERIQEKEIEEAVNYLEMLNEGVANGSKETKLSGEGDAP